MVVWRKELTSPQVSYTLSRRRCTSPILETSVGITRTFVSPAIAATSLPAWTSTSSVISASAIFKPALSAVRNDPQPISAQQGADIKDRSHFVGAHAREQERWLRTLRARSQQLFRCRSRHQ